MSSDADPLPQITNLQIAAASITTLCVVFALGWHWYAAGRDYAQHVDVEIDQPGKARTALNQECRQVGDVLGGLSEAALDGWTIRAGDNPRTDQGDQTITVGSAASDPARHEYVHACLFAAGLPGVEHHRWMTDHCTFCHGSPSCAARCLQKE